MLEGLPAKLATQSLEEFSQSNLSTVRNRSAYLIGVLHKYYAWQKAHR